MTEEEKAAIARWYQEKAERDAQTRIAQDYSNTISATKFPSWGGLGQVMPTTGAGQVSIQPWRVTPAPARDERIEWLEETIQLMKQQLSKALTDRHMTDQRIAVMQTDKIEHMRFEDWIKENEPEAFARYNKVQETIRRITK